MRPRWHAYSRHEPPSTGWYLVTTRLGWVDVAHWSTSLHWNPQSEFHGKVVAWKELPAPYRPRARKP